MKATVHHEDHDRRVLSMLRRRSLLAASSAFGLWLAGALAGPGNTARAAAGPAAGKRVAYVAFGLQFEYQVALVNDIRNAAKQQALSLSIVDGKGDPNTQTTEMLDAVSKRPDGILVDPVDAKLLIGGIEDANRAKIPVFVLENAPPQGSYEAFVTFGDEKGGRMGADALAKLIGGKGYVLECRGAIGSTQADLRYKGFHEEVASKYPGMTIDTLKCQWVADKAYTLVLDAFTRHPQVAAIWSHNDEMVRGVVAALRQIGRLHPAGSAGHVPIVGLDGTPLALTRIRQGIEDVSIGQNPSGMGSDMVNAIVAFYAKQPYERSQLIEPIVITKANVDDPALWGNQVKH